MNFAWESGALAGRSELHKYYREVEVPGSPAGAFRCAGMGISLTDGNGRRPAVPTRAAEAVQATGQNGFRAARVSRAIPARQGRQGAGGLSGRAELWPPAIPRR